MLKEMIIKRTINYFFITFLSIFISINASASVLNWKCTNSKNTFSTNYEIDLENKTITHNYTYEKYYFSDASSIVTIIVILIGYNKIYIAR